jgi:hypothetical protein
MTRVGTKLVNSNRLFYTIASVFFSWPDPLKCNLPVSALRDIKIRRWLDVVFSTKLSGSQAPLAVLFYCTFRTL